MVCTHNNRVSNHLLLGKCTRGNFLNLRERIKNRLISDTIGPSNGISEVLFSRPSSNYISGILFPRETRIPEEDHQDDNEENSGRDQDSESTETGVSEFRKFKPCTTGISFAVAELKSQSEIEVRLKFATYKPSPTFIPFDPQRNDNPRPAFLYYWERTQHELTKIISIDKELSQTDLTSEGFKDLTIYVRTKRSNSAKLVTVQVANTFVPPPNSDYNIVDEHSLFQFSLKIIPIEKTTLVPRRAHFSGADEDKRIANLIYRNSAEYATGHNCAANWEIASDGRCLSVSSTSCPTEEVKPVSATGDEIFAAEIVKTSIGSLSATRISENKFEAIEACTAIRKAYEIWILKQEQKIDHLEQEHKAQAIENMEKCKFALGRIANGIKYLEENADAMKAFMLANMAMRIQKNWSDGRVDWKDPSDSDLLWRPFQLAFAVMCIPSSSERTHFEREIFDLIWFPTGGGKTEAYLLLSAYVMILRRIRYEDVEADGVSVMMRYTLRTLTIQQYKRAAALITACEVLRSTEYTSLLGQKRFSLGLWVGQASTPNSLYEAFDIMAQGGNPKSTPKQMSACPRCLGKSSLSWTRNDDPAGIKVACTSEICNQTYPFNDLPLVTVDELLYREPPSMLIGTVDKFAQITRKREIARLFGQGTQQHPPDLIIQDELHLISGPLGSMTGLYETAIDELCRSNDGPVKIVGSTATIRRANDQVNALFCRKAFQFPPAGIDADNSGFATVDYKAEGRLYLGLSSAGNSQRYALQAIAASLLQSGAPTEEHSEASTYYETLVAYFNSLKELGGALVILQDDVPDTINVLANRRTEKPRILGIPEELTSRKASSEIPEILENLAQTSGNDGFVDTLLASNMLSVGVDIPRLGLMLVNGQPKTMSEYIQATSRVGRKAEGPGLVVTLFNDGKIRDKAYFETFKSWHSTLYKSVEASSVTPFASRARDKALHAPLIAIARHTLSLNSAKLTKQSKLGIQQRILNVFKERIERVDKRELQASLRELDDFLQYWEERSELAMFWNDQSPNKSLLISAEKEAARVQSGRGTYKAKATPNSMRNVEPATLFKIKEYLRRDEEGKPNG